MESKVAILEYNAMTRSHPRSSVELEMRRALLHEFLWRRCISIVQNRFLLLIVGSKEKFLVTLYSSKFKLKVKY